MKSTISWVSQAANVAQLGERAPRPPRQVSWPASQCRLHQQALDRTSHRRTSWKEIVVSGVLPMDQFRSGRLEGKNQRQMAVLVSSMVRLLLQKADCRGRLRDGPLDSPCLLRRRRRKIMRHHLPRVKEWCRTRGEEGKLVGMQDGREDTLRFSCPSCRRDEVRCCDIVWSRLHSVGTYLYVLGSQDGVRGKWVRHSWYWRFWKVLGRLRMTCRCR